MVFYLDFVLFSTFLGNTYFDLRVAVIVPDTKLLLYKIQTTSSFLCSKHFYDSRSFPDPSLKKLTPTCLCNLATVAGSCSRIKLLAPTVESVSKY